MISLIVVHCSATRVDMEFGMTSLMACHKAQGFKTIGYHYYVTKDGRVHPCRPLWMTGAHARGFNSCSIGVCYEGGFDKQGCPADTRTDEQKASIRRLQTRLRTSYPEAKIVGHRDLPNAKKDCPCFDATKEYSLI